jgi:hypothetical protein
MSIWRGAVQSEGFVVGPETAAAPAGRVSSAERLEIVSELLAAIDQATGAGQAHLMRRIVGIIREEILWPGVRLGPQLAKVMATVADLDHEVARLAPDPEEFCRRASGVLELLLFGLHARQLEGAAAVALSSEREWRQRRL